MRNGCIVSTGGSGSNNVGVAEKVTSNKLQVTSNKLQVAGGEKRNSGRYSTSVSTNFEETESSGGLLRRRREGGGMRRRRKK